MRFIEDLQERFATHTRRNKERLQHLRTIIKDDADAAIDLIQPTPEEAANGWTPEKLTEYIRDRETNSTMMIYGEYKERPTKANSRYRKLRW